MTLITRGNTDRMLGRRLESWAQPARAREIPAAREAAYPEPQRNATERADSESRQREHAERLCFAVSLSHA